MQDPSQREARKKSEDGRRPAILLSPVDRSEAAPGRSCRLGGDRRGPGGEFDTFSRHSKKDGTMREDRAWKE
jgi:hypothetical protein